jgi:UDP-galactopyranose mutase
MNTFTKLWRDVFTPEEAMARIEQERAEGYVENPKNLQEQAINLVGKTIFEKLVKGYTEKQWGKKCEELPAFIIKRLPVRFTFVPSRMEFVSDKTATETVSVSKF